MLPLLQAVNTEQKPLLQVLSPSQTNNIMEIEPLPDNNHSRGRYTLNHAIKAYVQCRSAEKKNSQIYWPKPLEINFLQIKDADDVATIYCKIKGLVIPCVMINTGSDSSIFSDNIAELVEEFLGIKIDRKKIHRLNGIASQSISIGTMDNVPITIGFEKNIATITDEFSVVPAEKDQNGNAKSLVILGTQWQYRAGWEPLIKGEFKATCNGKTITIPLSVHKSQRNIFTVEKEPESIKKKLVDRTCQYCGKEFRYPANLRQYFLRKNPCAVKNSHVKPMQSLSKLCAVENSHVKSMQSLTNPCLEKKNMVTIRLSLT